MGIYRDGITYRTINKISAIFDVSPVFSPAYDATSVSQRALDEARELEEKEKEAIEEARKQDLFDKLDSKMKEIEDLCKI